MKIYLLVVLAIVLILAHVWRDPCIVSKRILTDDGTIEIVDEKCQEGLPHTTNQNTIRMTQSRYDSPNVESILIHERIHLDQKRYPEKWRAFYKNVWDYDILKDAPPSIPYIYTSRVRPNPDTTDSPWAVWKNRYVFFPNFSERKTLRSANVYVWDLIEEKKVGIPDQWKSYFCEGQRCPHQIEHPHELSAEFIASNNQSHASKQLLEYYNNAHK